jgi:hypothetical protein
MRNSPSGSGDFTDHKSTVFTFSSEDLPGKYIVVPEENLESSLIGPLPAINPLDSVEAQLATLQAYGVQTRRGKIGRARAVYGIDTSGGNTARRKPTMLQWVVYSLKTGKVTLAGKQVALPWEPTFPVPPTGLKQLANEPLDFGSVPWGTGGAYALLIEIGAIIDPGTPGAFNVAMGHETTYEPLSPVPGPEGP